MRNLIQIPLQLFAYDEDVELIDNEEEPEEDLDTSEDEPGEDDDQQGEEDQEDDASQEDDDDLDAGDDEEEPLAGRDPKEAAIIEAKRTAKELKRKNQELEAALQALQEKEDRIRRERTETERKTSLVSEGYTEEAAAAIAKAEAEAQALRDEVSNRKFYDLERKYPGISEHKQAITELQSKLPDLSIEEIYRARFLKDSEYSKKTQTEQEIIYNRTKAKEKGSASSSASSSAKIKLSQEDERAFQFLKKQDHTWTRKRYLELIKDE